MARGAADRGAETGILTHLRLLGHAVYARAPGVVGRLVGDASEAYHTGPLATDTQRDRQCRRGASAWQPFLRCYSYSCIYLLAS
jgi:hypothetical protein